MILKKPYAFIIKHFRLIHLLFIIPLIFLIMGNFHIANFISEYIANNYAYQNVNPYVSLASNYIHFWQYLAIIVIIGFSLLIYLLLQKKEKPTKFYTFMLIYHVLLIAYLILATYVLNKIEARTIANLFVHIFRDFAFIVPYSQIIFVIFCLMRAIGFDLKNFDFKNDLKELQITEEDSEEFEFLVGTDNYKRKRNFRRFLRELKYYFLENKFVISIISVVVILILASLFLTRDKGISNPVYRMGTTFTMGHLNLKVNNAYLTHITSNGTILNDNKDYVVVNLNIKNTSAKDEKFNFDNLALIYNDQYYLPSISLNSYFFDFGIPYDGSFVKGDIDNDYILTYEIPKTNQKNFQILAYASYDKNNDKIVNKEININTTRINSNIETKNYHLEDILNFTDIASLGNSTLTLSDYEFTNNYNYTYNYCPSPNNCYPSTGNVSINYQTELNRSTLLVMNYNLSLDENSLFKQMNKDYISFFSNFVKIRYTINDKTTTQDIRLLNPNNYNERLIMKVNKEIENATSIEALITIRNLNYIIKLK